MSKILNGLILISVTSLISAADKQTCQFVNSSESLSSPIEKLSTPSDFFLNRSAYMKTDQAKPLWSSSSEFNSQYQDSLSSFGTLSNVALKFFEIKSKEALSFSSRVVIPLASRILEKITKYFSPNC